MLRESTRPEDLVARYGGEEFILALPVAAPDQATERAERIRINLAERRIVADGDDAAGHRPASAWPSPRPTASAPASALIAAADHCLYQAKNGGRNRVVFRHDHPGDRPVERSPPSAVD